VRFGGRFLAASDECLFGLKVLKRDVRRTGVEPAIDRDLPHADPEPFELGDRARQQRVLGRWV
jgi:hypothetical protein